MAMPQLNPPYKTITVAYDQNIEKSAYAASGEVITRINKGPLLDSLDLMPKGRYTTDGTPAGTRRVHNPYELLKNVRVSAGGDDLFNCSGLHAYLLMQLRSKQLQYADGLSATEVSAVATAADFEARLRLDFNEKFTEPEHAGALPTGLFGDGQVVLGIQYGGVPELVDSGDGTLSLVETLIGLNTLPVQDVSPVGYGSHRAISVRPNDLATTNSRFVIQLGAFVRGCDLNWLILSTKQGAAKNLSNAVFDQDGDLRLMVNGAQAFKRTVRQCRAITRAILPGLEDYAGILALPFCRKEGDNGGMAMTLGAISMSDNGQNWIEAPLVGAATNEIEVTPVVFRNAARTAAAWGLAG